MKTPPEQTPWGRYQSVREVIPGVWRVSTAGHGGFWLTPERLAEMPAVLREGVHGEPGEMPFNVDDQRAGWFEEDLEAFRVVLTFCVGEHVGAFANGNEAHKRATEYLEREYPKTVAALRATGFFDRGKPKGNPAIRMTGTS